MCINASQKKTLSNNCFCQKSTAVGKLVIQLIPERCQKWLPMLHQLLPILAKILSELNHVFLRSELKIKITYLSM